MQGSRCLLYLAALLLLGVTLASDVDEAMMQENEIDFDRDTPASKYDLDLQTIKKLIYADENRHREPAELPEEAHDRSKRGLRRRLKRIEEKAKAQVQKIIGKPGSKRRERLRKLIPSVKVKFTREFGESNRTPNRHRY